MGDFVGGLSLNSLGSAPETQQQYVAAPQVQQFAAPQAQQFAAQPQQFAAQPQQFAAQPQQFAGQLQLVPPASSKRPMAALTAPVQGIVPPAKRPAYAANPVVSADPEKAALVQQVKNYQRSSPEAQNYWTSYCETQLGGMRDPNRHTMEV